MLSLSAGHAHRETEVLAAMTARADVMTAADQTAATMTEGLHAVKTVLQRTKVTTRKATTSLRCSNTFSIEADF